jgi:hypothetical protein
VGLEKKNLSTLFIKIKRQSLSPKITLCKSVNLTSPPKRPII